MAKRQKRAAVRGGVVAVAGVFALAGCMVPTRFLVPPPAPPAKTAPVTAGATAAATAGENPVEPGEGRGSGVAACADVPQEAWETIALVEAGGPFPYPANDDQRFGNYEGLLPQQKSGYYREYTVDTPGVRHRGARRIVTGGGADGVVDEWFYTADHYESFCEVTR